MCNPALVLAAGTGLQAFGQISAGIAARQAARLAAKRAEFEAAVAENNALTAEKLAAHEIEKGKQDEIRQAIRIRQFEGAQKVAQAGLGQLTGAGTAVDIRGDTLAFGKVDLANIRHNAEVSALGFKTQGEFFRTQATLNRVSAKEALFVGDVKFFSGVVGAASSLATGASKSGLFAKKGKVPTIL